MGSFGHFGTVQPHEMWMRGRMAVLLKTEPSKVYLLKSENLETVDDPGLEPDPEPEAGPVPGNLVRLVFDFPVSPSPTGATDHDTSSIAGSYNVSYS